MTELEKAIQETAETALGMLKKSQMSFDFSAPNPHDHHKEYTRVNQSGTVSHIKAKGVQTNHPALTGLSKELHDKVAAGTHRLVAAVDGSVASLQRKHPQTGEWLIGTKVRQDVAKRMIQHLEGKQIGGAGSSMRIYTAKEPQQPAAEQPKGINTSIPQHLLRKPDETERQHANRLGGELRNLGAENRYQSNGLTGRGNYWSIDTPEGISTLSQRPNAPITPMMVHRAMQIKERYTATPSQQPAAEHPAKTAVKKWLEAENAASDHYLDASTDERETKTFKREYAALIKQRDNALKEVEQHANKMTDTEWDAATAGTDTDRKDFATEQKPSKPIWDSEAAVNDTKDIKRRLVAAGFKASEWSARADIVRSGARKGEIGDAIISYKYPLDAAQVVARTDSLLDAGFDVTWNTTKLSNGKRIIHPTVESVGRRGELKILDADKPVGQRITKYEHQAEAEAALSSF